MGALLSEHPAIPEEAGVNSGAQFLSFVAVGAIGFVIDASVLHLAIKAGLGLYGGRLVSFASAATSTWLLNRRYTFQWQNIRPGWREWSRYVRLMGLGGLSNYGIYALCVSKLSIAARWPVTGVAAGSLGGLLVNFFSSKFLIYRTG